ncbi:hypothetical protein GW915_05400 [bacterium]|nr:hypothetical protein [bacterium]
MFRYFVLSFFIGSSCDYALAQGSSSSNYSYEIAPTFGINLPSETPGASKTLYVFGAQADIPIDGTMSFVSGAYYQKRSNDNAIGADGGLRLNLDAKIGDIYTDAGLHATRVSYNGSDDRNSDGSCYLRCASTKSLAIGFFGGGGFIFPLGALPIRLGGRFYFGPSSWLLLYTGFAIRF